MDNDTFHLFSYLFLPINSFTNQLPMLRHGDDNVLCSQILTKLVFVSTVRY